MIPSYTYKNVLVVAVRDLPDRVVRKIYSWDGKQYAITDKPDCLREYTLRFGDGTEQNLHENLIREWYQPGTADYEAPTEAGGTWEISIDRGTAKKLGLVA